MLYNVISIFSINNIKITKYYKCVASSLRT